MTVMNFCYIVKYNIILIDYVNYNYRTHAYTNHTVTSKYIVSHHKLVKVHCQDSKLYGRVIRHNYYAQLLLYRLVVVLNLP